MTLKELQEKRPSQFKLLEYLLVRTNSEYAVMVSPTVLAEECFHIKRINMTLLINGLHQSGFVNVIPVNKLLLIIITNEEAKAYKEQNIANSIKVITNIINANVICSQKILPSIRKDDDNDSIRTTTEEASPV